MEQKDTSAIEMLTKTIDSSFEAVNQNIGKVKSELATEVDTKLNSVKTEINTNVDDKIKGISEDVSSAKAATQRIETELEEFKAKQATFGIGGKVKGEGTFNENLAETIKEIAPKLKNFRQGDSVKMEMKAVGDMSYTANFPTAGAYTDQRVGFMNPPQENIWLSDILPSMRTDGASVTYPQHTGGEGGAALWTSGKKPKIDFDFASATAHVKWIAGIVKVPREMLDDLDFLNQFIQAQMLRSLKIAENDFILNGSADTNPVSGLIDVAQAYNGAFTVPVERLVDAAWGQIVENDFNPTHFILQPRDAVKIGLNKSTGSGEYDLPQGTVGFANGRLNVAGLNTISTKVMTANNFLAIDRTAAMFVRRMNPELRVFDQNVDDVETNMITFRIEERVTLLTPYAKAFVKGLLTPA